MRLRFWRLMHDTFEWLWHWSWRHYEPLLPKYDINTTTYTELFRDGDVTWYRVGAPLPYEQNGRPIL